ncbi:hypothetical protein CYLTODRAFT_34927 [Cylindrobasidium torrendii FP15055 ss-10]|uniref:Fungal-type protein kinase domain-containing protein n=1 Tax=Cylindrobasidium torrendii FP15055 ss-10 TaxID=1314674 RepID=A0A0D7B9W7_9AGAR|nr:hypothetical protein CYLTODRAFT_34927 [Cylindrobasidium torrendii FP15055 ss-10]
MMYREAPDGTVLGVLIDFEMAWDVRDLEDGRLPKALQGTGQQPFRALDITKDKTLPHQYRYDLEAFVYSLLFLVGRYDFYATPQPSADGRETTLQLYCDTLLDWWDQPEAAARKEALILAMDDGRAKDLKMLEPLSGFKTVGKGLRDMVDALSQGYLSRALALKEGERFDDATLGGRVTYDRLLAAMDQ